MRAESDLSKEPVVVIGGDAAGMSAASKIRREQPERPAVVFERTASFPVALPPRYRALRTGPDERIVLEVESHLSSETVRCIGLTETRGLARGMAVRDT